MVGPGLPARRRHSMRRLLASIQSALQSAVKFPVSAGAFIATVSILRMLRCLRRPNRGTGDRIQRILVCYPFGNLGDLVLMLPMLEALHVRWPKAAIDVVARARAADLLTEIPFLGNVFRFSNRECRISRFTSYLRVLDGISLYRKQLMHRDYDLAISARWGEDPSFGNYLTYLTGAPKRCGYSAGVNGGNPAMDRVFTDTATGGHNEQEALRIVRLLSRVGLWGFRHKDEDVVTAPIASLQEAAQSLLKEVDLPLFDLTQSKYVVIAPGATAPHRQWPVERYVDVMERLRQRDSFRFILVGSREETANCRELVEQFPDHSLSLAGETTLHQLIVAISRAELFIGNDSGPAHIAGALGVRTVVVSCFPLSCREEHPNSVVRFRPCGPWVIVVQPEEPIPPCDPCCSMREPHCIQQITPQQVADAAESLIYPDKPSRTVT